MITEEIKIRPEELEQIKFYTKNFQKTPAENSIEYTDFIKGYERTLTLVQEFAVFIFERVEEAKKGKSEKVKGEMLQKSVEKYGWELLFDFMLLHCIRDFDIRFKFEEFQNEKLEDIALDKILVDFQFIAEVSIKPIDLISYDDKELKVSFPYPASYYGVLWYFDKGDYDDQPGNYHR